jgi:hypothetical protein
MASTRVKQAAARPARTAASVRLTVDQAVIAVLIAAMDANQHVSREEAWRAHHLIWSMRRFRNQPGEKIDRLIETVRDRIDTLGTPAVLQAAARTLPARLRQPVFAAAIDLMLVDTRLERSEKDFVARLTTALKVPARLAGEIVRVLLIKNAA